MDKIKLTHQQSWELGSYYKKYWIQEEINKTKKRNELINIE